jgi:hypothetical protein
MSTFNDTPRARRVWCDEGNLWVELVNGRQLGVPLAYFPALMDASPEQRERCRMSGGTGLHWEELDEDISVPALLAGAPQQKATA